VLSRRDIEQALAELDAAPTRRGATAELVLVGGAALALLLNARESTKDVDAIRIAASNSQVFLLAVKDVADLLSLPTDWLNDRASAFAMGVLEGDELWHGPALRVRSAGAEQLAAKKLSALRDDIDFHDARGLVGTLSGSRE
jgi:hypothetical protein